MKRPIRDEQTLLAIVAIILAATALWAIGCGGGGSSSSSSTPTAPSGSSGSGTVGATVTISATGLSNTNPRINIGERVRFTNNDSQPHQMLTTPHMIHTDCPGMNSVGMLLPGQSGTSDALTSAGGCGFHDHLNPDTTTLRGQALVGLSASDPTPPDPYYLRR